MSGSGEIVVEARGHRCPTPTLLLQRAVRAAPAGAEVVLLADDPLARIDAPHYAAQAGLELLAMDIEGSVIRIRVRKP